MKKLLLALTLLAVSAGVVDAQAIGRNNVSFGPGSSSWASAVTSDVHALIGLWNNLTGSLFVHTAQGGGAGIDWQLDQITYSVKAFGAKCDNSTDDTTAINAACTAAKNAGGGAVFFPASTTACRVSTPITISGATGVSLMSDGASIVGTNDSNDIILITGSTRVRVSGLTISHLTHGFRGGFGIHSYQSNEVDIDRNTLNQTAGSGMWIEQSHRVTVRANRVTGTVADGIDVTSASSDVAVVGNVVVNTADDCIAALGFVGDATQTARVTITGNTCFNSSTRGITAVGATEVSITGNVIDTTFDAGIYVAQETSNTTLGASHVVVSGNTIKNADTGYLTTPQGSIHVSGSSATYPVQGVMISGNEIYGGGFRYVAVGNSGVANSVDGISVTANRMYGGNTSGSGIEYDGIPTGVIEDNDVNLASASGIWVDGNSTSIIVAGNNVYKPNQSNVGGLLGVNNLSTAGYTGFNFITADGSKAAITQVSAANAAGILITAQSLQMNQGYLEAAGRALQIQGVGGEVVLRSDGECVWTADGNTGGGTIDTGIARDSAGVVRITDGSSGTGALKTTTITATASAPSTFSDNGIAASAAVSGLTLSNSTASTVGVPVQNSPCLELDSTAWSTGSVANQPLTYSICTVPNSGASISGNLFIYANTNGGGQTVMARLNNGGTWNVAGGYSLLTDHSGALGSTGARVTNVYAQLYSDEIGTNIASATTIAPTKAMFHVTGTTTIQTITPPTGCTTSGNGCCEDVVFDGVAPWNAVGNIFVAGTPTTAGTMVRFCYDPAQTKWYPSRTL